MPSPRKGMTRPGAPPPLPPRARELADLIRNGFNWKAAAAEMKISIPTAKTYKSLPAFTAYLATGQTAEKPRAAGSVTMVRDDEGRTVAAIDGEDLPGSYGNESGPAPLTQQSWAEAQYGGWRFERMPHQQESTPHTAHDPAFRGSLDEHISAAPAGIRAALLSRRLPQPTKQRRSRRRGLD